MVHVTRSRDELVLSVTFSGDDGTVGKRIENQFTKILNPHETEGSLSGIHINTLCATSMHYFNAPGITNLYKRNERRLNLELVAVWHHTTSLSTTACCYTCQLHHPHSLLGYWKWPGVYFLYLHDVLAYIHCTNALVVNIVKFQVTSYNDMRLWCHRS